MSPKRAVLSLRPTQFVLGMREVEAKIAKIRAMGDKKLEDWIDAHVIPCVEGPHGHTYLIDNHHFLAACYHAGVEEVKVQVVENAAHMTREAFWSFMRGKNWLYLNDQFGGGPQDPAYLPFDIRFLGDDLFRSLAWELRKAGLINKVQAPYSEFALANQLRKDLHIDLHATTYAQAVAQTIAHFTRQRGSTP
jgi:hypothetical protein